MLDTFVSDSHVASVISYRLKRERKIYLRELPYPNTNVTKNRDFNFTFQWRKQLLTVKHHLMNIEQPVRKVVGTCLLTFNSKTYIYRKKYSLK